VGKTTISALTGLYFAKQGKKTAIVSIDPAHSIGDVLGAPVHNNPTPVGDFLDLYEIRLSEGLKRYWKEIHNYLVKLFRSQGVQGWVAEEIAFLPGLDEILSFLYLKELKPLYTIVVIDCPPTGSTLRFLNLPEAIEWYMRKIFPLERKVVELVGPIVEKISGVPLPDREVFTEVMELHEEIRSLKETLTHPEETFAQLVTTPEKVVLKESERAFNYLSLQGIPIRRIVVNRVQTSPPLEEVESLFAPVPCKYLPLLKEEPVGIHSLSDLTSFLEEDLSLPSYTPLRWYQEEDSYALSVDLRLPPEERKFLQVGRKGDDLILTYGALRRIIPLPFPLAVRNISRAEWKGNSLTILFH
jgi:arsenite-transporting ATPase